MAKVTLTVSRCRPSCESQREVCTSWAARSAFGTAGTAPVADLTPSRGAGSLVRRCGPFGRVPEVDEQPVGVRCRGSSSYGAYVPVLAAATRRHRRRRWAAAAARAPAAWPASTRTRTSLGVEAARVALARRAGGRRGPRRPVLAPPRPPTSTRPTPPPSTPPWPCPRRPGAYDARRVGALERGRLQPGRRRPGAGGAERRPHRPAGRRRRGGGRRRRPRRCCSATAPAVIAETIGGGTATGEFLDRWRTPGDDALAPVGGALRRARLRAPGRGGGGGGAEVGRPDGRRPGPRHRHRPARPGRRHPAARRWGPGPRRWPTTSPPSSATPAPPTVRSC